MRAESQVEYTRIHVVTHANCPDGYTARWLFEWLERHDFPIRPWPDGVGVVYHDFGYQDSFPVETLKDNDFVLFADFCFGREAMAEIADRVHMVIVLDHHKTGAEMAEAWQAEGTVPENLVFHFVMEHSGAMLMHTFLFEDRGEESEFKQFVAYVEDRDLWKMELPDSRDIAELLIGTPFEFDAWHDLALLVSNRPDVAVEMGAKLRISNMKMIEALILNAREFELTGTGKGRRVWEVLACPCPYQLGSTLAGELAERSPVGIGAYYVDNPVGRQWGLRSVKGGPDVSEIAAKYGGGGHEHAAGFTVEWGHRWLGYENTAGD